MQGRRGRENKTPQQIRREKQEERGKRLAQDLRYRFKLELKFMACPAEEVELLRTMFLAELGYDPELAMRQNSWDCRVIYHATQAQLSQNAKMMQFFARYLEEYQSDEDTAGRIY